MRSARQDFSGQSGRTFTATGGDLRDREFAVRCGVSRRPGARAKYWTSLGPARRTRPCPGEQPTRFLLGDDLGTHGWGGREQALGGGQLLTSCRCGNRAARALGTNDDQAWLGAIRSPPAGAAEPCWNYRFDEARAPTRSREATASRCCISRADWSCRSHPTSSSRTRQTRSPFGPPMPSAWISMARSCRRTSGSAATSRPEWLISRAWR